MVPHGQLYLSLWEMNRHYSHKTQALFSKECKVLANYMLFALFQVQKLYQCKNKLPVSYMWPSAQAYLVGTCHLFDHEVQRQSLSAALTSIFIWLVLSQQRASHTWTGSQGSDGPSGLHGNLRNQDLLSRLSIIMDMYVKDNGYSKINLAFFIRS